MNFSLNFSLSGPATLLKRDANIFLWNSQNLFRRTLVNDWFYLLIHSSLDTLKDFLLQNNLKYFPQPFQCLRIYFASQLLAFIRIFRGIAKEYDKNIKPKYSCYIGGGCEGSDAVLKWFHFAFIIVS